MTDAHPQPLILAQGIRFPTPDEVPAGWAEQLERVKNVAITTGYVVHEGAGEGFQAYFEANAHADRLWPLVRALAEAILPPVAAPIVGIKDEEAPTLGPYTTRNSALGVFEPFVHELQHDGFLEFGVIFQYEGRTEEVFVKPAKWLQVWTNSPERVRDVFRTHRIPEVPTLAFVDEYPLVSETLTRSDGSAGWAWVIDQLRAAFAQLPAADRDEGV